MRKIKKGDKVQVIAGKFKGAIFEVEKVDDDKVYGTIKVEKVVKNEEWKETKIIVENIAKKAVKGRGFIEKRYPIHISNVMYYCEKCKKPVRVWVIIENGKKKRYCKKCKTQFI